MKDSTIHIDVLHVATGRIRFQLDKRMPPEKQFCAVPGIQRCSLNQRLYTLLCWYDSKKATADEIIAGVAAVCAGFAEASIVSVKRLDEKRYTLPSSGKLALSGILMDSAITLTGSNLTRFSHWISAATTLAAVFEHGYHELQTRGSFDPEVMSVVYLMDAISKGNAFGASVFAWIVTFGRHLITREPREQAFLVRKEETRVTLTPVSVGQNGIGYAKSLLSQSFRVMATRGGV